MTPKTRWQAALALLGVSAVWGSTFVIVKSALTDVSVLLFLTLRFTLASVFLLLFFRRHAWSGNWRSDVWPGIQIGFFLFTGYITQTFGLKLTTPAKAGFLTALYVVLVPLLGSIVYSIRPGAAEWFGVAVATAGMALLTLPESGFRFSQGDLLVAACAIPYAMQLLLVGRFAPRSNAARLSLFQVATGAGIGWMVFWWLETPRISWTYTVALALGITSALATALAFAVQSWAQKYTGPTRAALIFSTEPLFAWLTSYVLTGETLSARASLGAVLILAGVLLVELKPGVGAGHPSG
ncbi:MAG: DMT family transporter [Bryobacteraceae bacterium]|nr:DMT family transporter [Bryobacteraceae bacterium]